MRHSDAFVYLVFLIYAGSLGLAFTAAHSFSVFGSGEMLLLGVALLSGPLLIAFHLVKESERLVIAAVHIFLAVLFHPEVTIKDPLYLNTAEQFELLRRVNEKGDSWWVKADMSYDLARSLKADATIRFKISSPFWYWAFPPSVVLTFWGVVFFFRFPKADEG
jgi:hypothetical protein